MSKMPQPFRFRNGWRAQVTLRNGSRPAKTFATHEEAKAWIAEVLANNNGENLPLLGGPTQARLADMLDYYVRHVTVVKGGAVQEINRANHYLLAAGLPALALWQDEEGKREIVTLAEKQRRKRKAQQNPGATRNRIGSRNAAGTTPESFARHNEERSCLAHPRTYEVYEELATKRASQISGVDIRNLHSTMTAEGYSLSTIQKEIALLKALFNEARNNWNWPQMRNPCDHIKLKKAGNRFIEFTDEKYCRLIQALAECDNPEMWPLVELAIETALRQSSLLRLEWGHINFVDRKLWTIGKGHESIIPLSQRAVQILKSLPKPHKGRVFSMSENAVQKAWARIREKAQLSDMKFRDLRHVAPTEYARGGMNAFQIRDVLGHKTTVQAATYVNLVNRDVLDAMDRINATITVPRSLPPVANDWSSQRTQNKTRRLKKVEVPIAVVSHDTQSFADVVNAAHDTASSANNAS